jgi:hypothetical protein
MVLAEIGSTDLLWSILEFFFLFISILILFQVIGDLFRDHTMSGGGKALWVIFILVLPRSRSSSTSSRRDDVGDSEEGPSSRGEAPHTGGPRVGGQEPASSTGRC